MLSAVRSESRGVGRRFQSAEKPECPKCGHAEHVVRMWHGQKKVWVCNVHYQVQTPETKPQTLKQRIFHKKPEAVTIPLGTALPNRRTRRGSTR